MREELNSLSNEQLVKLAQEGDRDCYNILLGRHRGLILSLLRTYHLENAADRDDFIQIGYIALWESIKKYDETRGAGFCTFAFLCIQRNLHDAARQLFSDKNRSIVNFTEWRKAVGAEDSDVFDIIDHATLSPESATIDKEDHDELHAFLKEHLTDRQYTVLILQSYNLSYEEIANALHITVKQVDNTLQAVRKKLRSIW